MKGLGKTSITRAAIAFVALAALYGCQMYGNQGGMVKGTGFNGGNMAAVAISGYSFSPSSVSFPATNTVTVTWTNYDNVQHTVTSNTNLFNATVDPGKTFSYIVPTTPGVTYSYHCTIHPYMTGSLTAN